MKNKLLKIIVILCVTVNIHSVEGFSKENLLDKKLLEIEEVMMTKGDYKETVSKLMTILETHPEDPKTNMDLGLAYYGLMEYRTAYEYFKKAEQLGELVVEKKKLLSYIISVIENNKDLLEGIEADKNALESAVDSEKLALNENLTIRHYTMLTELLKEKYFYPIVVVSHIIWLKENAPDLPGLYELSAGCYYSAMHYRKAIEDYEKAIKEEPDKANLYEMLGDSYVAIGNFDKAGEYYHKVLEFYKKQGLKDNSQEVLKIKNIRQALPKRYKDIADLVALERYYEAEEICKERISLNAGDVAAITQLGQIYWEEKKRKAAIKMFQRAVKMAPDYPVAHFFVGKAYIFERKPEKAFAQFKVFKEKMDLLPNMDKDTIDFYVNALHSIAYMYIMQGEYGKAIKECKSIVELKPTDQTAYFNMAVCYHRYLQNRPKAYTALQKAIEIDPNSHMADRARFYLDFMRRNPDARIVEDFDFIYED